MNDEHYMNEARDCPDARFADNDSRSPHVLLLDTSKSVERAGGDLNNGVQAFARTLKENPTASNRVEVAIVTFGKGGVNVLCDFTQAKHFTPPTLTFGGDTPLGQGTNTGLDLIAARKQLYRAHGIDYSRPWVTIITDGAPTDHWQTAAARLHEEEAARKIACYCVGFGNADMNVLRQLAPPNRPPLMLNDLRFEELFTWLSKSQIIVSAAAVGTQQALPPVDGWAVTQR